MQIHAGAAARRWPVVLPRLQTRHRADDALAVPRHPRFDDVHAVGDLRRQRAVAHRAHVKQQVAAAPGHLAQRVDESARRLPCGVSGVVGPALVHRHAGLPRTRGRPRRYELLGRLVVAAARQAVVDQDLWLQRTDHRFQLDRLPLQLVALPAAVKPDDVDLAVAGQQLADLPEHAAEKALPRRRLWLAPLAERVRLVGLGESRIVGVVPVDQREVDADADALRTHRIDELAHDVPAVGRMLDRKAGMFRVKHRIAVVMLRGKHRVLHAGALRALRKRTWIPEHGVERGSAGVILLNRHILRLVDGDAADERPR